MLHYGSPSLVIDPNQWTILALRLRVGAVQTRGEAIRRCAGGVLWGGALVITRYMALSSSVFEYKKISYCLPRPAHEFRCM